VADGWSSGSVGYGLAFTMFRVIVLVQGFYDLITQYNY